MLKNHPLVDLTFWSPGDPRTERIDALLVDPRAPLAKHGLTGIAAVYASTTGAPLHDLHAQWADELAIKSLGVDGALAEAVPALRGAGIDFFIAKGPAIAYFNYPDPRMRPYTDLDVYVPEDVIEEARDVMRSIGYERVPQVTGPLGGLGAEMHGGSFGAVVEVHSHVIDNLHRRYVAPVRKWLEFVEPRSIMGVDVPVPAGDAHVALQAIHLGAGHRYQKLVLYRDVAALRRRMSAALACELGASSYLAVVVDVLTHVDGGAGHVLDRGLAHTTLVRRLAASDPSTWDEYRLSVVNTLALVNQRTPAHASGSVISALRVLSSNEARRVNLRWSRA